MHKLTQNNDKNDAPPPPETKTSTFVPDKANKTKKPASKDSNPNSRRGSTKENKDQNMNRKGSKKATSAPKYNRADIHDAFFAMMTAYVENHEAVMEEKNRKV